MYTIIPGADHILAQPLKQCSVSRIKPNETFELAKKRQNMLFLQNILCFGVVPEKGFPHVVAKLHAKSQNPWKISLSYSLAVKMGSFRHGEMKIWLCLYFQHVTRYIGTDFVEEKQTKKCKDQKRSIFLAKGALIGKSRLSNTANRRCSRQVLQLRCSSW